MDIFPDIVSWLRHADELVLLSGNGFHTFFLDRLMWGISDRWVWLPLYAALAAYMFYKYRLAGGLLCMVTVAVLITATDQTCASLIRPALQRLRPSSPDNPLSPMVHLVNGYRGGRFGFPSCHAANTFALAVFLSLVVRRRAFILFIVSWSLLVSYSRIYMGVHYPGDIAGGFAVGSFYAAVCYRLMTLSRRLPELACTAGRRLPKIFPALAAMLLMCPAARAAEPADTVTAEAQGSAQPAPCNPYRFRPLGLAIPATLIGVGIAGLESDWLKGHNHEVKDELQEHDHGKLTLDDFTQYLPLAATWGLRLAGVKGLHDWGGLAVITATAYALTAGAVYGLKTLTKVERPDGSAHNSFPSGHTATAFAGAELLRKEYRHVSPWIGVAGYAVAAGTGFFRMYNNRHWLTDVIAGAGIGILSVQAAYWLYPAMSRLIFGRRQSENICVAAAITAGEAMVSLAVRF